VTSNRRRISHRLLMPIAVLTLTTLVASLGVTAASGQTTSVSKALTTGSIAWRGEFYAVSAYQIGVQGSVSFGEDF
jgi:hypothetical protein